VEAGGVDQEDALRLLKGGPEGVTEWNTRRKNGETIPRWPQLIEGDSSEDILGESTIGLTDLRGVDLNGANLRGVDLSGADLSGADLSGADLLAADLHDADLQGAILSYADLHAANLNRADFRGADLSSAGLDAADLHSVNLSEANLRGANLTDSDLSHADLSRANLTSAFFAGTNFVDVKLSDTSELATCLHLGPSNVDVNTLFKSANRIPESFLRGCGVPDALIAHLPLLLGAMQPIQFYSCFISHSSADKEFARRLHSRMREEGLRVWFDEVDMQ
jgi:hypothetical protein